MDPTTPESHFLRHISDLADKQEVLAHSPIHSSAGTRLVDSGERITRSLYDDLAKHHLLPSVEECLVVDDAVTPASLAQAIEELLGDEPAFASLVPDEAERHKIIRVFATIPLSPALAFKLTVAREERPEVMQHSLQVAFCAAALAHYSHLPPHEIVNAAAAGLFHDLGLLHIDPDLLRSMRPLSEQERHHLYSHPLTAYLILERNPIWHPIVSTAVLEHHERIDGSGYPKGLTEARLGSLGQLLAVAELAATMLSYGGDYASRDRLGIVLRMNEGKLNHEHCNRLLAMFPPCSVPATSFRTPGAALELLVDLSVALLRWQAIHKQLPASPLAKFIDKRMTQLNRSLADVGLDLEYWSAFHTNTELDGKSLGEMEVAAREAIWQMHAIANEVYRRWEHIVGGSAPIAAATQEWLGSIDGMGRE
jgi:HD-GYP domain-containing protein (c-di-GMP phosphodiesterase class II)